MSNGMIVTEPPQVVWSANRDNPVGANATLSFSASRNLVLFNSKGDLIWCSNTSDILVSTMRISEKGNLVMFNSTGGKVWQSFDHLTDTLLEGQILARGKRLISRISAKNMTRGLFYLSIESRTYLSAFVEGGKCTCPVGVDGQKYLTPINSQFLELGCRLIHEASSEGTSDHEYRLVKFENLSYFSFSDHNQAIQGIDDEDSCLDACKRNTSCKATFFEYNKHSSKGYCFLAPNVLTLRKTPSSRFYSSSSHIKILTSQSNVNSNSSASHNSYFSMTLFTIFTCALVFLMVIVVFMLVLQKKKLGDWLDHGFLKRVSLETPRRFSYDEICSTTSNFSELLGQGGFGTVFKGVLKNGTPVAVKRLHNRHGTQEFLAEVETIGNLHHINLVRLIGFCASRKHRMLVYDYMRKGFLDKWLFRQNLDGAFDWNTRKKIVIDVAKGLTYLHEECRHKIAHFDVKPHNILLYDNFSAKLSYFGLSKLIKRDANSPVIIGRRGTSSYQAPEWQHSRISVKADVFSFGIVLLEIICRRNVLDYSQTPSDVHLLSLLVKKAFENQLRDMIDRRSEDMQNHVEEAIDLMRLGMWCADGDCNRRPSMSTVVKILEGWMPLELISRTNLPFLSSP
ncbi:Serine/threonine protein kinase [Parasponia andersonii]|uniref:non-specific serine/threonine protein kinase n=1 Tax=Parasponia andersonii TaxID=3476 RepID=A0A2P5E521_PARAD|nr:Serine/threonine protein kinase [Parasponia andersonii]